MGSDQPKPSIETRDALDSHRNLVRHHKQANENESSQQSAARKYIVVAVFFFYIFTYISALWFV